MCRSRSLGGILSSSPALPVHNLNARLYGNAIIFGIETRQLPHRHHRYQRRVNHVLRHQLRRYPSRVFVIPTYCNAMRACLLAATKIQTAHNYYLTTLHSNYVLVRQVKSL